VSKNMKDGVYRKKSVWVKDPNNVEKTILGQKEVFLVKIADDLIDYIDNASLLFSKENSRKARRNCFVDALASVLGLKMKGEDPIRDPSGKFSTSVESDKAKIEGVEADIRKVCERIFDVCDRFFE